MASKNPPLSLKADLHLAFDIGHASIGWAVLNNGSTKPALLGCGSVIFPPDDCLASARRKYRRQRRHIRATRQRIGRLAILLNHLLKDAPAAEDRDFATHLHDVYLAREAADRSAADFTGTDADPRFKPDAAPWRLAGLVLSASSEEEAAEARLTWPRLWDVLRWYAHNRGYDGNRLWSKQGADSDDDPDAITDEEDAEKVRNARKLLDEFHRDTMAETICAKLHIGEEGRIASSEHAYKTSDAAFPRNIVLREVRRILEVHVGHLTGLDAAFVEMLCARDNSGDQPAWRTIPCPGLKFPARYQGGLLFGQLVPRFDNRIIGLCPASGEKKPLKRGPEFLRFRWAQILANVTVPSQPGGKLTSSQKLQLTGEAEVNGGFAKGEFKSRVRDLTSKKADNLDQLLVHPDADKALVLDPALRFSESNEKMKALWPDLADSLRKHACNRWRRNQPMALAWFLDRQPGLEDALRPVWEKACRKQKKNPPSWQSWLRAPLAPEYPTGRAPYARKIMAEAAEKYLGAPEDDPRLRGGLLDPIKLRVNDEARSLDALTNNHLIRQRLRILEGDDQPNNRDPRHRPFRGLLADLVDAYAGGEKDRVANCTVEVATDLQAFSGKTNKEIASDLGIRLKNFQDIVKKLHEDGIERPTAGLIRKARIADDMEWRCPYTDPKGLRRFDCKDLQYRKLDKDHIIPRTRRQSDSLDSLVITYPEVNRLKGDRTALQFMREFEGKEVKLDNGQTVNIASVKNYLAFVEKLAPEGKPNRFSRGAGHLDDKLRRWRRKQRLLIEKYTREDKDFTPGDLTATSHLSRMAAERIVRFFGWHEADADAGQERRDHRVISLPGQVTAEIRKAWKTTGCLAHACPDVMESVPDTHPDYSVRLDADGNPVMKEVPKPKKEIRGLTHLHHALDASVMAFASALLPSNGKLWEQIANRKVRGEDLDGFHQTRKDARLYHLGGEATKGTQKLELADLPDEFKNQIAQRLLERRVVQRVPSDMSGALLEETTWSIQEESDDGRLTLRQYTFDKKDNDPNTGARHRTAKKAEERAGKLLGLEPGKLRNTLGVRVIAGNFGLALFDPALNLDPEIIPHHQVWKRLAELKQKNGGKPVRVLKNGMMIRVLSQPKRASTDYTGLWRVFSVKNNESGMALDLARPDRIKPQNKVAWAGINVGVRGLLDAGMEIEPCALTGAT